MLVSDAYSRLTFKIGTPDDSSARAVNPQVSNIVLLNELYDQLKTYANITKGIQDVYSFPLNQQISFVAAPPLALRSRGYFYAYVIANGTIFPMDFRGPKDVYTNFRVNPVNGITNWLMPWNAGHTQYLSGFPNISTSALTTTLTGNITSSDTTIPVASTAGQVHNFGRITIGSEKIMYEYTDQTNFYGCVRGIEQTTAASHSIGDIVTQNNVFLFYSRLPVPVAANSDGTISAATLAQELEPCDEHMEGIIKVATFNILIKIDIERANANIIKYDEDGVPIVYKQYRKDIAAGYARNRQNVNIRSPFPANESGIPYGTNLIY